MNQTTRTSESPSTKASRNGTSMSSTKLTTKLKTPRHQTSSLSSTKRSTNPQSTHNVTETSKKMETQTLIDHNSQTTKSEQNLRIISTTNSLNTSFPDTYSVSTKKETEDPQTNSVTETRSKTN